MCKRATFLVMILAALMLAAGSAWAVTIDMLNVDIGGHPRHQGRDKNRWGFMDNAFGAGTWMDVRAVGHGPTTLSYRHSASGDAGGLGVDNLDWGRWSHHGKYSSHPGIPYESMRFGFSEPVTLNSIDLAFFDYKRNPFTGRRYHERGYVRIYREGQRPINVPFGNGPSPYFTVSDNNGIYSLLFNEMTGVKGLWFHGWRPRLGETHNYAIHSFQVNHSVPGPPATPEPATMLLLGSAMGMLGFIRRRRQLAPA